VVPIGDGALSGMVGLTLAAPLTSAAVHTVDELQSRNGGIRVQVFWRDFIWFGG